ncbi:MAG: replicative DNA helicase [Verrucomicrobia bacterium]|nr:replicative DNA helicase [Verrucomicrobiota bacterium]
MIDTVDSPAPPPPNPPPDLKRGVRQRAKIESARVDREPPHSEDAERAVMACLLLEPSACIPVCIGRFKGDANVFYDPRHQVLYDTLVEMFDEQAKIDVITVHQRLKERGKVDMLGGVPGLSALQLAVGSAASLDHYADIVRAKHLLRQMIATCSGVISRLYDQEGDVDEIMDEVERDVLKVCEARVEPTVRSIKDLTHHAIGQVQAFHENKGALRGLSTGFPDLDRITTGLQPGEMIVIAARPSMGKTSLAMNIAENVVLGERPLPVGVFSLEMTAESLVLRILCSHARVNMRQMREGFMEEREFPRLTTAAGRLCTAPLFIDDTSGLSILQLRAKARRMAQQYGVRLFVIDYLQLLHSTAARSKENRQQEIAEISSGIKALAKELRVPVIVLAQLNREIEKDRGRKPRLSDLRESGAIEQDADLVGLLYKPATEDDEDGAPPEGHDGLPVNLFIAKQRNGPTGDIPLTFLKGYTRFESAAKISADDVPGE